MTGTNESPSWQACMFTAIGGAAQAQYAVDGNANSEWGGGSCTHTLDTNGDNMPWWQVDLGSSVTIGTIDIYHRTDCCEDRLVGAQVFTSSVPDFRSGTICETLDEAGGQPERVSCGSSTGRY
jgi:hypothetical protein